MAQVDVDVASVVVVVAAAPCWAFAVACSTALNVAASTLPVGATPSAVCKFFRASVSSGVHLPSTGPASSRPA